MLRERPNQPHLGKSLSWPFEAHISRSSKTRCNTPQPTGKINAKFEEAGLRIRRTKAYSHDQGTGGRFLCCTRLSVLSMTKNCANSWRPSRLFVQVLEGEGAIRENAKLWAQPTQPTPAAGTIRAGNSLNSVWRELRFTVRCSRNSRSRKSVFSSPVWNWLA